jgi:hypothetical protein
MARRTRSARKSGDPSRPNIVLVILVVFFFLSTAILGGLFYFELDTRAKNEEKIKQADKIKNGLEGDLGFYQGVLYAWRAMMGDGKDKDDENMFAQADSTETGNFKEFLDKLDKRYAEIKDKEDKAPEGQPATLDRNDQEVKNLKLLILKSRDDLGWDEGSSKYLTRYSNKYVDMKKDRADALEKSKGHLPDIKAEQAKLTALETQFKGERKKQWDKIKENNDAAEKEITKVRAEMTEQVKANGELAKQLQALSTKHDIALKAKDVEIAKLKEKLDAQGVVADNAAPPPAPLDKKTEMKQGATTYAGAPHALMLDISKGKALWDTPRGRITTVEEKSQRVFIDKGSADGIRPQMTFTVFGAGWDKKAEKMLKGTIEVVRVEAKTAEARVTSLYDADGREIALGDQSPNKALRVGGNPLREGDLLFNLAWGSHVAIAGVIDWNGQDSQTPAAQAEDIDQFRNLLKAQGITVDCFIDLRDGKMYGAITPKTNYLIRGYGYGGIPENQMTDTMKAVNESITLLRKEALERGVFVISPENFGMVIGYRRPTSALATTTLDFRPSLPSAGTIAAGAMQIGGGKQ